MPMPMALTTPAGPLTAFIRSWRAFFVLKGGALKHVLETGHFGPWTDTPDDLPMATET